MSAAELSLAHGDEFPFDASDEWWASYDETAPAPGDWAHRAARGVIADLKDRRDIKRGFENIDEDVRIEIVFTLAEIIRSALRDGGGE